MTHVEDLERVVLARLPCLRETIEREIVDWKHAAGGSPPTADYLFGAVLVPIVISLLSDRDDRVARSTAEDVFAVLEDLLADENPSVRDVVAVSFCEQLAATPPAHRQALELAGPLLRSSLEEWVA